MKKIIIIDAIETTQYKEDHYSGENDTENIIELYESIEKLYNIDSLELLYEQGVDIPCRENMVDIIELRDLLGRLPIEIVRLGQKRVAGYPLTTAERKQLERFRKKFRNGGSQDIF